jgi:hypothetical protein
MSEDETSDYEIPAEEEHKRRKSPRKRVRKDANEKVEL